MIDDDAVDNGPSGAFSVQPWMIGTEETGQMTMGIQFNDDTHAKFSSWVGGVAEIEGRMKL